MKKKRSKVVSLFLLLALLSYLAVERKKGFSLTQIYTQRISDPLWEVSLDKISQQELGKILDQTYFFAGSGRQCFAFVSKDEQYVIKFINQAKFSLPSWFLQMPLPYFLEKRKKQKQAKRKGRISAFYNSFKLAFDHLKEETGLVYIHLYPQIHFTKPLKIIDPIGYSYEVDLNQAHFMIQKKVDMIYPYLEKSQNNGEAFEKGICSYLDLVFHRMEKGFCDDDLNIDQNVGFVEGKATLMDFGRIYPEPRLNDKEEIVKEVQRSTKFFKKWLKKRHPKKFSFLEKKCQERTLLFLKKKNLPEGN